MVARAHFAQVELRQRVHGRKAGRRGIAAVIVEIDGIGLTQSFALELGPFRIKVNSICPGNFYDGPLWSDP